MITVAQEIVRDMINHAREEYPRECCGMLAGKGNTITKIFKIKNIAKSADEYELNPSEQVNAFEEIDRLSLTLLGVYHSHPYHSCYPSPLDIRQAFYPDTAFFIISLMEFHHPQIKAFKMQGGEVIEETTLTL